MSEEKNQLFVVTASVAYSYESTKVWLVRAPNREAALQKLAAQTGIYFSDYDYISAQPMPRAKDGITELL